MQPSRATAYRAFQRRANRGTLESQIERFSANDLSQIGFPSAYFLGIFWGALVGLVPVVDFLARPQRGDLAEYEFAMIREAPAGVSVILAALLCFGAVPVALAGWRCGIDFRQSGFYPAIALSYILIIAASLMGLETATLVFGITMALAFALSTTLASLASASREVVQGLLTGVSLVIAIGMVAMIWDANYSYGRLLGRSGPNYWGMSAIVAVFASIAIRSLVLKVMVAGIALMTVYLCQSRGSMMAISVGAIVVWLLTVYHATRPQRLLLVGGTAFVGILGALILSDFILSKLLLVDNKSRGIESGATGRSQAWIEAIELFLNSPWLGVGYRQHEHYLTAASSAHNAYLAALADTGIFGFVVYLTLMIGGAAMAVRKAILLPHPVSLAVAGLTVATIAVGLVERVGMTTGNALGLMMIYVTAWVFRSEPGTSKRKIHLSLNATRRAYTSLMPSLTYRATSSRTRRP